MSSSEYDRRNWLPRRYYVFDDQGMAWQVFRAPYRGINSAIEEKHLDPEAGFARFVVNMLPTGRRTVARRPGLRIHEAASIGASAPVFFFDFGDSIGEYRLLGFTDNGYVFEINKDDEDEPELSSRKRFWTIAQGLPEGRPVQNYSVGIVGGTGNTLIFVTIGRDVPLKRLLFDNTVDQTRRPLPNTENTGGIRQEDGSIDVDQYRADTLTGHNGFLLLGSTREREGANWRNYPYRLRWSKFGVPDVFKDLTPESPFRGGRVDLLEDEYNGRILRIVPLRKALVVYKENSIYNIALRQDGSFYPEMTVGTKGVLAPGAVAPVRNGMAHLVISHDDIYLYDGFKLQNPAIGMYMRDKFFDLLQWSPDDVVNDNFESIKCVSFPQRQETWIFCSVNGNAPDGWRGRAAWCWDWKDGGFTFHELPLASAIETLKWSGSPRWFSGEVTSLLANSHSGIYQADRPSGVISLFEDAEGLLSYPSAPAAERRQNLIEESHTYGKIDFSAVPILERNGKPKRFHLGQSNLILESTYAEDLLDTEQPAIELRSLDNPVAGAAPLGVSLIGPNPENLYRNLWVFSGSNINMGETLQMGFYWGAKLFFRGQTIEEFSELRVRVNELATAKRK